MTLLSDLFPILNTLLLFVVIIFLVHKDRTLEDLIRKQIETTNRLVREFNQRFDTNITEI